LGQHKYRLMGSQHSPDLHLQYVYKQTIKKKTCTDSFLLKKTTGTYMYYYKNE
jgi:hypothetical protein